MSWLGFGLVPPDGFGDDDDDALDVGAGVVVAPMTITLDLGLVASVSVLIPLAALAGRKTRLCLPPLAVAMVRVVGLPPRVVCSYCCYELGVFRDA